jgi:hypothetical protein
MTAEKSTITTTPEATTTTTTPSTAATSVSEKMDAATEYQENIKEWFTSLSPEDRAAALGFTDGPWTALWTQVVKASLSSSKSEEGTPQDSMSNNVVKKGASGK